MNLFRAELARYIARRGIALLMLAGFAVVIGLAARTAWETRPPSPSELATASANATFAAHDPQVRAQITACQKHPARYLGPGSQAAQCAKALAPTAESLLPRSPLSLRHELNSSGAQVAVLLAAAIVIAGATFAGADWQTGAMRTQLIARRRRSVLWSTKAAAVVAWSALYGAAGFGLYWLILGSVAQSRDISGAGGLTSTTLHHILAMGGRAVVLTAAAGLGAFALTMLLRHTVATLGLLFAYAAGGEVLLALLPVTGATRWSVGVNLFGWLQSNFHYTEQSLRCRAVETCGKPHALSHLDAGLFLGALLVIAVVASMISFSKRDV